MTEETRPTEEELAKAEAQCRQLHRTAFKMVRAAVEKVAAELCEQCEEEEVWCAVASACQIMSDEANVKMDIAELRAEGAPAGFVKLIEDIVNLDVGINSGQYDEPLAAVQLTDENANADVDEDSEEEDDETGWDCEK